MTIQPVTSLRQRMIKDVTIRHLKERTQVLLPALCDQISPAFLIVMTGPQKATAAAV
jgi:hypothetical protein